MSPFPKESKATRPQLQCLESSVRKLFFMSPRESLQLIATDYLLTKKNQKKSQTSTLMMSFAEPQSPFQPLSGSPRYISGSFFPLT